MRKTALVPMTVALVSVLGGCTSTTAPQVTAINEQIDELGLHELGDLKCNFTYEPGPFDQTGNRYLRQVVLDDEANAPKAIQALEDQGFEIQARSRVPHGELVNLEGPNGMTAGVSTATADAAGTVLPFDGLEDCPVPTNGLIVVGLSLPK
ncbi:hypothetical protein [Frigoribacterium sp. NPDC087798]|jgi:hypothetical protein|uniref:hypothetical protein n=1 Tax=Frigoribacterium sp. NPDC087798 TaxID=3363993 RepID=UPI00381C466A